MACGLSLALYRCQLSFIGMQRRPFISVLSVAALTPQWQSRVVVPGTRGSPRVQCVDCLALEEAACLLQKKVCVSLIFLSSVESAKKETVLNDSAVF